MLYNQPFGITDPDASYINGNPATGTMGSIPPAASIEFPQREIVAMIKGAGLAPVNEDLGQLLKALKLADVHNVLKMGTNLGTANQWSMSCPTLAVMPPPVGTAVWFKPGFASVNGGTLFSINGSAFLPVVVADLTPLAVGDVLPSAWLLLYLDGAHWQAVAGSTRQFGAIPLLVTNTNWYVNGATGDDVKYDGSMATFQGGEHGPFRTLQRAAAEVIKYNQNGYDQFVNVADYSAGYANVVVQPTNGTGYVNFIGNIAHPENVPVTAATPDTQAIFQNGGYYRFRGFRLSSTGTGASDGFANNGGNTTISDCRWGPCNRFHMSVAWNGYILLDGGTFQIEGGANTSAHMSADLNSQIASNPYNWPSVNILGSVNMNHYCEALYLGVASIIYQTITGKANVHGMQYFATGNGTISPNGGGPNFFPGDLPGQVTYGGQYTP